MIRFIINNKVVRLILSLTTLLFSKQCLPQGYNSNFLIGYQLKARMLFTDTSYVINPETRTIPFRDTQGNISDENGNLLMSSNGIFIADATGDTMLGGGGLNPNSFTDDFKNKGLVLPYGNIILPMPDDSNKYVLFHQTGNYNSLPSSLSSTEIYYSVIDISLNGGLGEVISKNNIALTGLFGWGLSACKHANGRDWWVFAFNDSANYVYKFLITPTAIQYIGSQFLNVPGYPAWAGQPTVSPDGTKFAYSNYDISMGYYWQDIRLFDFDRCSGNFTFNSLAYLPDSVGGGGVAFSPNSRYLYVSSWKRIYQLDTYSTNVAASMQLIAINDSFPSPSPPLYTDFFQLYLAANGKIYISSGSSVVDLHEMDYPDSAGIACNVNLHNIHTNCFFIGVPNHPNYYLGRLVGSPCDTLTSISDIAPHDFKFSISPNPSNGNFKIMYLLPQNSKGILEVFDINGKAIYKQNLPPWSTMQYISLPKLANGVYQCVISSGNERVHKKLVVFKE